MEVDRRGHYASEALRYLEERLEPGEPFLVLPEGIMLNYLARRPTTTKYLNFMPPEFLLFGEATIREELIASTPEVVVLVHKDTSEYGPRYFGSDYGQEFGAWLDREYEIQRLFGSRPLSSSAFGIAVLGRRP